MPRNSGKAKSGFQEGRSSGKSKRSEREEIDTSKLKKTKVELKESLIDQDGSSLEKSDRFAKEFRRLRKQVGAGNEHFNAESTSAELLRALLAMVTDLIPVAERSFRSSGKENAAYALNALVNQARELDADLRLRKDFEGQALFIKDNILTPVFKAFVQQMLNEHQMLKSSIDSYVTNSKDRKKLKVNVDDSTRALGTFIQETITKSFADIDNYLQGNMQALMPSTGKKRKRSY